MQPTFEKAAWEQRFNEASDVISKLQEMTKNQEADENELLKLRVTNAEKYADLLAKQNIAYQAHRISVEDAVFESAIKHHQDLTKTREHLEKQALLEKNKLEAKAEAKKITRDKNKSKEEKKQAREAYKEKKKQFNQEYKDWYNNLTKKEKAQVKSEQRAATKAKAAQRDEAAGKIANALKGENKIGNTIKALGETAAKSGGWGAFSAAITAVSDLSKQLTQQIDTIGAKKGAIDTRLQGSKNATKMGSYWDKMSNDITGIAGVSPLVRQEAIVEKLQTLVGKGISFNVEQRAFLDTIKDKIATTFDAADGTLLRLVRIQQADTTAARLGMESALTAFLNNMYETTEYMTDAAATIRSNLSAATALMGAQSATEFEYQVQKWMGSLYSVGMSQEAVSGLAGTLGKIAAGDVSGITGDGKGNLMIMAANNAGISIADALQEGLDASKTNQLMSAMVNYLSKIYDESQGSKVIQQQFASVYGITAADLKAAKNLANSTQNIYNHNLNYGGMLGQLSNMAGSMYSRTSMGEIMSNAFENLKYTMSAGIANNPVLYALFKSANMLDDLVGGIDFSLPLYMGTGTAQTFNVADIMRVGALSGSIIGGLGRMISSGSGGGISGIGMLNALGINNGTAVVKRGTGGGLLSQGPAVEYSESGSIAGNESSEDLQQKSMSDSQESVKSQTAEAADESTETTLTTVNENVVNIYTLLQDVVTGTRSLHVDMGDIGAWTNALRGV